MDERYSRDYSPKMEWHHVKTERTPLEIWEALTPRRRAALAMIVATPGADIGVYMREVLSEAGLVAMPAYRRGRPMPARATDLGRAVAEAGKAGA